jgi:uncharacterized membrane protein YgaE (UPF0421/DUF939 family)
LRLLRATGVQLLQTAAAAGLSWYAAHDLLGHRSPFFAPIAAVIALGVVPGNHVRRAVEIVLGVGVGIAVGDLLIAAIGHGSWQVALVVLLAMAGAVLLGGGVLLVSQAAASAVLVATVSPSTTGAVPTRFVDALVGGTIALGVLAVAPRNAGTILKRAAAPVFTGLAATLEDIASALEARDLAAVNRALTRARTLDDRLTDLRNTVQLATETVWLAPLQRRERGRVARYSAALPHVGYAARNTRVLARAAVRAVELEPSVPPRLLAAVRELAVAVRELEVALDSGDREAAVRRAAQAAAVEASESLEDGSGFAIGVLVGQVRSIATDVLRALGLERQEAVALLRETIAAGERPMV